MSRWDNLPQDLLHLILQLPSHNLHDLYQYQSVCSAWRSVSLALWPTRGTPLLLLVPHDKKPIQKLSFNTSLVHENRVDHPSISMISSLDDFPNPLIVFSSYRGWLLVGFIDSISSLLQSSYSKRCMYLYNPISRTSFHLPTLPCVQRALRYGIKFITSTSPNDPRCVVFVLWKGARNDNMQSPFVAFCEVHESKCIRKWRILNEHPRLPSFEDMIFYQGRFCVVTKHGQLFVYDNKVENIHVNIFGPRMEDIMVKNLKTRGIDFNKLRRKFNLVESKLGKLFMIESILIESRISSFRVLEMNMSKKEWEEVGSFGGGDDQQEALFLAWNEPMFVPIITTEGDGVFKPNCIYFIDKCKPDDKISGCALFVYGLGNHTIENFNPKLLYAPEVTSSLWFRPDLSKN